jgi:hypothetical protein
MVGRTRRRRPRGDRLQIAAPVQLGGSVPASMRFRSISQVRPTRVAARFPAWASCRARSGLTPGSFAATPPRGWRAAGRYRRRSDRGRHREGAARSRDACAHAGARRAASPQTAVDPWFGQPRLSGASAVSGADHPPSRLGLPRGAFPDAKQEAVRPLGAAGRRSWLLSYPLRLSCNPHPARSGRRKGRSIPDSPDLLVCVSATAATRNSDRTRPRTPGRNASCCKKSC